MANDSIEHSRRWTFSTWFRATFLLVGGTEVFLGCLTLCQGVQHTMSGFGIPEAVVQSPHYLDAMRWVFLHMTVLGSIVVTLGVMAREVRLQKCLTWLLLLCHSVYAFLDVRASDNPLGTALYQGNASLVPAMMSCSMFLLFLHLAVRSGFSTPSVENRVTGIDQG